MKHIATHAASLRYAREPWLSRRLLVATLLAVATGLLSAPGLAQTMEELIDDAQTP